MFKVQRPKNHPSIQKRRELTIKTEWQHLGRYSMSNCELHWWTVEIKHHVSVHLFLLSTNPKELAQLDVENLPSPDQPVPEQ